MSRAATSALVGSLDEAAIAWPASNLDAGVLAARAADLVALNGLDPLLTDEWETADLIGRAGRAGISSVAVDVPVVITHPWSAPTTSRHADNEREWRRRWPTAEPGAIP